jgi:cyanate permease
MDKTQVRRLCALFVLNYMICYITCINYAAILSETFGWSITIFVWGMIAVLGQLVARKV